MVFDTRRLKKLAISETGFIFDPTTGYIFTTNPIGILIIKALKDGKDFEEIKEVITKEYNCKEDAIEEDIYDFINQLRSWELIKDGVK